VVTHGKQVGDHEKLEAVPWQGGSDGGDRGAHTGTSLPAPTLLMDTGRGGLSARLGGRSPGSRVASCAGHSH
jgi:hypothetical protein